MRDGLATAVAELGGSDDELAEELLDMVF